MTCPILLVKVTLFVNYTLFGWPNHCDLPYTISESGIGCELHTIKSAESLCRESLCLYTLGKKVKVCTV